MKIRKIEEELKIFIQDPEYEIKFCRLNGYVAEVDEEEKVIRIDVEMEFCDTILHEFLHIKYPKWSERKISNVASKILSQFRRNTVEFVANYLMGLYLREKREK